VSATSPPRPPPGPPMSPMGDEDSDRGLPDDVEVARLLPLTAGVAIALLAPASADAHRDEGHTRYLSGVSHRQADAAATGARRRARHPTTNPVAVSLKLAERYWHGVPACGAPHIAVSPHQLPNSVYETTTGAEPDGSVVEMWTEVVDCTITINASVWPSWHEDDEFFQWFCDSMTHEVGHLFGHLDAGQADPSSIEYPFLNGTSPNFNSVPECRNVTLRYGSQKIRNGLAVGP
jgi:hypothetical protein